MLVIVHLSRPQIDFVMIDPADKNASERAIQWCPNINNTNSSTSQPDMLGYLTHVVRLNWQDWAGHSSCSKVTAKCREFGHLDNVR